MTSHSGFAERTTSLRGNEVSVVIVTYNSAGFIEDCLSSVLDQRTSAQITVTVVDNASADGTGDLIEKAFSDVRLIRLGRNTGFAVASNTGIRASRAATVLLLNPDTVLPPGTLESLLEAQAAQPRAAFVGCKLVRRDGSVDHACKRSFPTEADALAHFASSLPLLGSLKRLSRYSAPSRNLEASGEVDAINGALMLIRRDAIDEFGLLDESYWMYGEDLDWCKRAWDSGWKVYYSASPTVTHVKGASAGKPRSLRVNFWFHRAMLKFYMDHHKPGRLRAAVATIAVLVQFTVSTASGSIVRILRRIPRGKLGGRWQGREGE